MCLRYVDCSVAGGFVVILLAVLILWNVFATILRDWRSWALLAAAFIAWFASKFIGGRR